MESSLGGNFKIFLVNMLLILTLNMEYLVFKTNSINVLFLGSVHANDTEDGSEGKSVKACIKLNIYSFLYYYHKSSSNKIYGLYLYHMPFSVFFLESQIYFPFGLVSIYSYIWLKLKSNLQLRIDFHFCSDLKICMHC